MKNISAIGLILLLLLNVLGYQFVFFGLRLQNEYDVKEKILNERYDANQTFTLRIPLNLPYSYNQNDFHVTEGKFAFEGNAYKLVDQRVYQDTLYLVCLHDETATRIEKQFSDFVKFFTEQPSGDNHQKTQTIPSFIKEYLGGSCQLKHINHGWTSSILYNSHETFLIASYSVSIVHPPECA